MKCSKIRSLIDESDRPDRLAPDVLSHTALCTECRVFAEERARLSELLVSVGRVNAPPNFDAMLRVRLAEQTAPPRLRLSPAMFFRFGGAMAAIVLTVLGATYLAREKTSKAVPPASGDAAALNSSEVVPPDGGSGSGNKDSIVSADTITRRLVAGPPKRNGSLAVAARGRNNTRDTIDPGPVFWLKTDEMEVGVPVVSTGAQPLYYATAGQPSVRTVKTSF